MRRVSALLAALSVRLRGPALLSLLDQGAVSGFGFLAGIAAARLIDMEGFGRFALVLIVAGFAQGLHNALVTAPLMTLAGSVRDPARYAAAVGAGALVLAAGLALGVAGALALYFAARGEAVPVDLVTAAGVLTLAQNLQLTARRLLFAYGGGLKALAMDLARAAAFPLSVAGLWAAGVPLDAARLVELLALTAFLTTLPTLVARAADPGRRRLATAARRHWQMARWLLPVVLVTFGQEQLVWILAGGVLGDEALGGLRAAQYLVGLVLLTLAATENVVPTGAGRAYDTGGEAALRAYLLGVTRRLGIPVLGLLALVAVPAELWLRLVFGEAYAPYAPALRWLALGVVFIFLRDMAAQIFRARRRTDVIFRAFAISLAVSLALIQPLLTRYGATGAAAAVVLAHGASLLALLAALGRAPVLKTPATPAESPRC
ncbi:Membrane protein involved in the export of O-antigen and teichoic acid [Methylobacterium sp. 174MFSha1.1]|uniref:lipopolysaccharide biosynthesis protein n=1 Tax=Methylobacterium sp. 174MFSha1.1 TaxID=1502749 RepID=UPI0008DEE940|nr:polysaccharide biosynthesis C-terminal domain-containing protein [Methylobacterium sp. 174MFSha1.1]SFV10384.1 Membrane protein involved in the export of O-antigen and teichoic acid [Methylobacterium sp. 174MFSha1.1]